MLVFAVDSPKTEIISEFSGSKPVKIGKEIEKLYNFPQDIERAWVSSSRSSPDFPGGGYTGRKFPPL